MSILLIGAKKIEPIFQQMVFAAKMMKMIRTFRTSNSIGPSMGQICSICKNNYLPGQIVINRKENTLHCVECEWEALYMTKIYPDKKPEYTPYPFNDLEEDFPKLKQSEAKKESNLQVSDSEFPIPAGLSP